MSVQKKKVHPKTLLGVVAILSPVRLDRCLGSFTKKQYRTQVTLLFGPEVHVTSFHRKSSRSPQSQWPWRHLRCSCEASSFTVSSKQLLPRKARHVVKKNQPVIDMEIQRITVQRVLLGIPLIIINTMRYCNHCKNSDVDHHHDVDRTRTKKTTKTTTRRRRRRRRRRATISVFLKSKSNHHDRFRCVKLPTWSPSTRLQIISSCDRKKKNGAKFTFVLRFSILLATNVSQFNPN